MTDHVRTFAKYFTNLLPSHQRELERVFADLQNSMELTNLESSLKFLRKKVDQNLPIPQPTSSPSIRGAVIEWPALLDQRVNMYEVDISDDVNFSSFTTISTIEYSVILDGLLTTKYARVKGLRRDGTTTPYSDTVIINPRLFGLTSHAEEDFYVHITGTTAQTVLGGPGSDLDYTPINENGNSMVWGFICSYGDPAVAMWGMDEITVKCYSKIIDEDNYTLSETLEWETTLAEHYQSQAIGPFIVAHPEANQNIEIRLDVQDSTSLHDGSARPVDSTEIRWCHLQSLELGL